MPVISDIHLMTMLAGRQISHAVNDAHYNGLILLEFLARRVPLGNHQASYDLLLEVAEHAGVTRDDLAAAFRDAAGRNFIRFGHIRIPDAVWTSLMCGPESGASQVPMQYYGKMGEDEE